MDTGTHLAFGLGLGGLAMVDPVFSAHPYGSVAILIGTVVGSNAPDFDGLYRLKSNADYIKHHRGLSHSFPMIAVWTIAISGCLALLFQGIPWWHYLLWVLLSVVVHVLSDLFNSYGTQGFRPISQRWVAWNIINIFDPVIFCAHLLAILLWVFGAAAPQTIFPILYGGLAVYYVWRTIVHFGLTRHIPRQDSDYRPGDHYQIIPTVSLSQWSVVRQSQDGTYGVGVWEQDKLRWVDSVKCIDHPAIDASRSTLEVQAFLSIVPFPYGQTITHPWGYEVRWSDIRYRYRKQYPFVAIVHMDRSYSLMKSYVGWLNDKRIERRLQMKPT
jgi:inner membrane protein